MDIDCDISNVHPKNQDIEYEGKLHNGLKPCKRISLSIQVKKQFFKD